MMLGATTREVELSTIKVRSVEKAWMLPELKEENW